MMEIPSENSPWYSTEHGWLCGALPVSWWGAFLDERPRLPARWRTGPDGSGEIEPTDFEVECFVHIVSHEQARLDGVELMMLADQCHALIPVHTAAVAAVEADPTASVIGWCPGLSWHWDDEDMPQAMARKFASR